MADDGDSAAPSPVIRGRGIHKVFGRRPERALRMLEEGFTKDEIHERIGLTVGVRDSSFEVHPGEIFVVMGLSGSGKSTLLRLINRLIEPTSGTIEVNGRDVTALNRRELIELRRSDLTMVFQSFALMQHLNVWENAAFGLRIAGAPKAEQRERAQAALAQVGLESHAESYPRELSGGMQQRVGLARALAASPTILLMDEAFSALDPLIRTEMQDELLALQRKQNLTVVFISHDLDEAMRIGDRIAIMHDGHIVQSGTPDEILRNPANDYVRSFFGGVDIAHVYTAGDLARPDRSVLRRREGQSARTLLYRLRDADRGHGYVVAESGHFEGVVSLDSLLGAVREESGALDGALLPLEPIAADAPFDDLIHCLTESPCPVPVVDEENRFLGIVTKSALLETLESRTPP